MRWAFWLATKKSWRTDDSLQLSLTVITWLFRHTKNIYIDIYVFWFAASPPSLSRFKPSHNIWNARARAKAKGRAIAKTKAKAKAKGRDLNTHNGISSQLSSSGATKYGQRERERSANTSAFIKSRTKSIAEVAFSVLVCSVFSRAGIDITRRCSFAIAAFQPIENFILSQWYEQSAFRTYAFAVVALPPHFPKGQRPRLRILGRSREFINIIIVNANECIIPKHCDNRQLPICQGQTRSPSS